MQSFLLLVLLLVATTYTLLLTSLAHAGEALVVEIERCVTAAVLHTGKNKVVRIKGSEYYCSAVHAQTMENGDRLVSGQIRNPKNNRISWSFTMDKSGNLLELNARELYSRYMLRYIRNWRTHGETYRNDIAHLNKWVINNQDNRDLDELVVTGIITYLSFSQAAMNSDHMSRTPYPGYGYYYNITPKHTSPPIEMLKNTTEQCQAECRKSDSCEAWSLQKVTLDNSSEGLLCKLYLPGTYKGFSSQNTTITGFE